MSPELLSLSDDAVDTAFIALEVARRKMDEASAYIAPYGLDDDTRAGLESIVVRAAADKLSTARNTFTNAVLNHSIRVVGPNNPYMEIDK